MPGRRDPVARIFEGLLHALARYGVNRTSMTDVSTETGISRGTLYRYFSTKEELLDGLASYLMDDLRQRLRDGIEERPEPDRRIEVTLEELRTFSRRRPSFEQLIRREPQFVIQWYRSQLDPLLTAVAQVIAPAVDGSPEARQEVDVLARLLVRLMISFHLLPGSGDDATAITEMAGILNTYAERCRHARVTTPPPAGSGIRRR